MLGVRIAKRKIEPQKPANPCDTRLCSCIFFVNTLHFPNFRAHRSAMRSFWYSGTFRKSDFHKGGAPCRRSRSAFSPTSTREKRPCPRGFYTPPAHCGSSAASTTATPSSTPTRSSASAASRSFPSRQCCLRAIRSSRCLTRRATSISPPRWSARYRCSTTQCSSSAAATACRATRERSGACSRATRCRRFFSSTRWTWRARTRTRFCASSRRH